jgi:hypothetical protein
VSLVKVTWDTLARLNCGGVVGAMGRRSCDAGAGVVSRGFAWVWWVLGVFIGVEGCWSHHITTLPEARMVLEDSMVYSLLKLLRIQSNWA